MMVPFRVLSIRRHLVFRGPKRDGNFDNHPYLKSRVLPGDSYVVAFWL